MAQQMKIKDEFPTHLTEIQQLTRGNRQNSFKTKLSEFVKCTRLKVYDILFIFVLSITNEGHATAKTFSNSAGSKIPIKIGSRSRSR